MEKLTAIDRMSGSVLAGQDTRSGICQKHQMIIKVDIPVLCYVDVQRLCADSTHVSINRFFWGIFRSVNIAARKSQQTERNVLLSMSERDSFMPTYQISPSDQKKKVLSISSYLTKGARLPEFSTCKTLASLNWLYTNVSTCRKY